MLNSWHNNRFCMNLGSEVQMGGIATTFLFNYENIDEASRKL